jgi:hypothetical protein
MVPAAHCGIADPTENNRIPARKPIAIAMYTRQLIATEDTVIRMPGSVLRQPITSIMDDGQRTYIRLVCPIIRTPATPNQRSASTAADTSSPTIPPAHAILFVVKSAPSQKSKKGILDHQVAEASAMLQIFAVKNPALALERCRDDEGVVPGELVSFVQPQGVEKQPR